MGGPGYCNDVCLNVSLHNYTSALGHIFIQYGSSHHSVLLKDGLDPDMDC